MPIVWKIKLFFDDSTKIDTNFNFITLSAIIAGCFALILSMTIITLKFTRIIRRKRRFSRCVNVIPVFENDKNSINGEISIDLKQQTEHFIKSPTTSQNKIVEKNYSSNETLEMGNNKEQNLNEIIEVSDYENTEVNNDIQSETFETSIDVHVI